MSDLVNLSHLVTVGVALGGWFAVHRLTAWRDRVNHNRKMRTDFLVKAFQGLANAANRPPTPGAQHFRDMESAVADIQLLGSKAQVELVEKFTEEFEATKQASLDPLLNSLRKDLRKELGYEQLAPNVKWFRPEGGATAAQPGAPVDTPRPAGSCRS
jgi:predicted nucleotidyltransferase